MTTHPRITIAFFRELGLPDCVAEFKFSGRRWKFDYAWPTHKVALEVEGGTFGVGKPCPLCKRRQPGRHTTGAGMRADMEKYNTATVMGWRVIRCEPKKLLTAETVNLVKGLM